ncbi:MAG: EMC3/TMCO1 family protein [Archaeoglobaceae archaeon]|nr:EMC3/TMCO1 family protein [Archaeoglobaceae archaeon]MDW8128806.1 EMC3/TMCO1 family protein [Archaeoglobaceae archaeon]
MKSLISKFLVILGFLILFGLIFSYEFRIALAVMVERIFFPLSALKFFEVVLIMSILTGFYSNLIQKYTVNHIRLKEIQKKISEYQKEYMDAVKKKNQFKLKQLESKKEEMKMLQSELMSMQFKPMSYTFIVSIPIWAWLWEKAYLSYQNVKFGVTVELFRLDNSLFYVTTPFWGTIHVNEMVTIFPWWLLWYLICSIMFGQLMKKLMKVGV